MTYRTWLTGIALVVSLGLVPAPQVSAQAPATVTMSEIQRLQDGLFDASRDVAALRSTDAVKAARLEASLDEVRDDVAYLRGKLRREGRVSPEEYASTRQRLDDLRAEARGMSPASSSPAPAAAPTADVAAAAKPADVAAVKRPASCGSMDVCVGQEIDVRVQVPLNSNTANVEDRFEATTLVSFYNEQNELIPAGSLFRGVVSAVERAGRVDRKGSLSLSFDQMMVRGRSYRIRATVTQAIESEGLRGETAKIGAGAGVGAIIGGILGGVKGALSGILIGGGGVVAATEGRNVEIPAGTVLRVRFDSPVTVTP